MKAFPKRLNNGYIAEFDNVSRDRWYEILDDFSDSNLYQTWSYDVIRYGEQNISHLILFSANKIVAAAQVRIERYPILGMGAAYVRWGPLWQDRINPIETNTFQMAIRALRNEYVCRRGLILRIFPVVFQEDSSPFFNMFRKEDYVFLNWKERSRTLLMDIRPSIEELRRQLSQRWRRCLTKAEKNNLEIIEGTDDNLFENFLMIYREMLRRKKFQLPSNINEYRVIQRDLPQKYKMKLFLCKSKGMQTAGGVFSAIGDTGIYLHGATNDQGMKNNSSYLIHWKAIQWMKKCGCNYANLNGINPKNNPGVYVFKSGLAGASSQDVSYIGFFDCYPSRASAILARAADLFFQPMKKARNRLKFYYNK